MHYVRAAEIAREERLYDLAFKDYRNAMSAALKTDQSRTYTNIKKLEKSLANITERIGIQQNEKHRIHKKNSDLEKTTETAAIIGLIGGLFFLSSNITGNAIGSSVISNSLGAVLLIVGLVAGFFWLKRKKK